MSATNTAMLLSILGQQQAQQQAQRAIESGKTGALSKLGEGYTTARGDISGSMQPQLDALRTGYNTARDDVTRGMAAYDPFYSSGTAANSMLSGALGLGGADGSSAARAAFQTSPGFEYMRDSASDNALRKASAVGGIGGNQIAELGRIGTNLANQEYGSWLDRLSGLSNTGMNAAGARMQGATNLGNLANSFGANNANVIGQTGARLADLASGFGSNQANVYTGSAANQANTAMSGANAITSTLMNAAGTQDQMDWQRRQVPMTLAAGALGALGGIGSGMAYRGRLGF